MRMLYPRADLHELQLPEDWLSRQIAATRDEMSCLEENQPMSLPPAMIVTRPQICRSLSGYMTVKDQFCSSTVDISYWSNREGLTIAVFDENKPERNLSLTWAQLDAVRMLLCALRKEDNKTYADRM